MDTGSVLSPTPNTFPSATLKAKGRVGNYQNLITGDVVTETRKKPKTP